MINSKQTSDCTNFAGVKRGVCEECGGCEDETQDKEITGGKKLCAACYMDFIGADPDYYEEWQASDV